jgi:hypothetical protein
VVVIDKDEYDDKVQQHLDSPETYEKLVRNPINTLQSKVNRELQQLR